MKTKTYRYSGPSNGVTLAIPAKDDKSQPTELEVLLWQGKTVELPEGHEVTASLLAMKYLHEIEAPIAEAAASAVAVASDAGKGKK